MSDRCRAYQLALVLGALDPFVAEALEACDEPADHVVILNRDGVGVDAPVCAGHERIVAGGLYGYVRSIRKHARAA